MELTLESLLSLIGRDAARRMIEAPIPISSSLAVGLGLFATLHRLVEPDLAEHQRQVRIEKLDDFDRAVLEILTDMQVRSGGSKKFPNSKILDRVNFQRGEHNSRYRTLDALNRMAAGGLCYLSGAGRGAVWSIPDDVLKKLVEADLTRRKSRPLPRSQTPAAAAA
jgi:hypothetical protein